MSTPGGANMRPSTCQIARLKKINFDVRGRLSTSGIEDSYLKLLENRAYGDVCLADNVPHSGVLRRA